MTQKELNLAQQYVELMIFRFIVMRKLNENIYSDGYYYWVAWCDWAIEEQENVYLEIRELAGLERSRS